MDRRTFLAGGLAGAAAAIELSSAACGQTAGAPAAGATPASGDAPAEAPAAGKHRFKLKYAPHFGQFEQHAGKDLVDQLKFIADEGFTALEDNGMMGRPPAEQELIGREMARLGLTMGEFVAYAEFGEPTLVHDDKAVREMLLSRMKEAIKVAQRVNGKLCLIVPGCIEPRLGWDYQTANLIDHLKSAADLLAAAGLTIVLEPLNPRDHPRLFLTKIAQAYQICRAVGNPACKTLDDIYHQQITEGDLIPNIDRAWSEIAYFHLGDTPGRKEPTSGEINFRSIFAHLHAKGYQGVLGMEHGASKAGKEGERAVIDAYVACDTF